MIRYKQYTTYKIGDAVNISIDNKIISGEVKNIKTFVNKNPLYTVESSDNKYQVSVKDILDRRKK